MQARRLHDENAPANKILRPSLVVQIAVGRTDRVGETRALAYASG